MTKLALVAAVSLFLGACGTSDGSELMRGEASPTEGDPANSSGTSGSSGSGGSSGSSGSSGSGGSSGSSGTSGSSGSTDAGSDGAISDAGGDAATAPDAAVPVTAFTGAGAYVATTGPSTNKGAHGNGGNPAKRDCMTSSCHGPGGDGPRFVAGGTVYKNVAGNTPAAQVEVRFRDADGTTLSAYTNADGNFFVRNSTASAKLAFPLKAGARDATTTKLMAAAATGACNSTACHGGAATGWIHVP